MGGLVCTTTIRENTEKQRELEVEYMIGLIKYLVHGSIKNIDLSVFTSGDGAKRYDALITYEIGSNNNV
jgi:hypothetical protein